MKPEPLTKEKIRTHLEQDEEGRWVIHISGIRTIDVKSAVQWLLEEIEKKDEEVSNALKEILDGKRKDTNVNRGALYGWGEALFWVKQKIRKAFSGAIE